MADDFLKGFDWDTFDLRTTTQEVVDRMEEPTAKFFMAHTKAELLEGAVKHRVMLYPVSTTRIYWRVSSLLPGSSGWR